MMLSKVSRSFVACNIYISAGGHPNHRDMLVGLLGETQELCHLANNNNNNNGNNNNNNNNNDKAEPKASDRRVVVVHAFRDGPYDRSSFHLAGSPDLVADVGSSLATRAVQALVRLEREREREKEETTESIGRRHPTVGLVDHVSVLPLDENNDNENENSKQNEFARIAGSVARTIGESLQSSGADVLYYGHAHPTGKELAAVRRDSTGFFEDSKKEETTTSTSTSRSRSRSTERIIPKLAGQATVGAPDRFVENYNIRLRQGVSRRIARTLTESVREKSGRGLPFVEALTLAYGRDQYEVACNLLDPFTTSSGDVDERIRDWEKQQQQQQDNKDSSALVETAYRVGTSTDMCLEALRKVSTKEGEMAYNKEVFGRLDDDFLVR